VNIKDKCEVMVVDLMLLLNAEYLEMTPGDDDVVSELQDIGAVSQVNFLRSLEGKTVALPADWRADMLLSLLIIPDAADDDETGNTKKLSDLVLDIADIIAQKYRVIEVPFAKQVAIEYARLLDLLPPDDDTEDVLMDTTGCRLTCKYAALARSMGLGFKTNNYQFYDLVIKGNPDEYSWVELIADM